MIFTDIDIKDTLKQWIDDSGLAAMITGSVYKDKRPLNSQVEDAIIAVIARDADSQIQRATVNVNIYVPDKRRGQEAVEDSKRLRALTREAAGLFEYANFGNWICELGSQEIMEADGIDWHIINNRLNLRFSNETT